MARHNPVRVASASNGFSHTLCASLLFLSAIGLLVVVPSWVADAGAESLLNQVQLER